MTVPLSPAELVADIDSLATAATKGPWRYHDDQSVGRFYILPDELDDPTVSLGAIWREKNAAFIVALVNNWTRIAELLRRLDTAEARERRMIEALDDPELSAVARILRARLESEL